MAEACRKAYAVNIGIGVTGTMGNVDPANKEASVPGQVYFAISFNGEVRDYYREIIPQACYNSDMEYLAILGRQPEISIAEIEAQCLAGPAVATSSANAEG